MERKLNKEFKYNAKKFYFCRKLGQNRGDNQALKFTVNLKELLCLQKKSQKIYFSI